MLMKRLHEIDLKDQVEGVEEFYRESIRYALNITRAKKLNDAARECGVFEQLKPLKNELLKGSIYVLNRYWKAMYHASDKPKCSNCIFYKDCKVLGSNTDRICESYNLDTQKLANKYKVEKEDIDFSLLLLTQKDKKKIRNKYKNRDLSNPPFSVEEVFLELRTWCYRNLFGSYKKKKLPNFRFVLKYYWDLTADDIVNDLLVEGYLRAMECDTIKDRLLFKNTVKKRIIQRACNKIESLTKDKRSRLTRDEVNYKKKITELAKQYRIDYLTYEEQEKRLRKLVNSRYEIKVLSLDYNETKENKNSEDSDHSLHATTKISDLAYENDPTNSLDEERYLDRVVKNLGGNRVYKRILKVIMGHYDEEVSEYIKQQGQLTQKQFIKKVLEFFHISKKEFKQKVVPAMIKSETLMAALKKFNAESLAG